MCLCLASIALAGEATSACQTISQDFKSSPFYVTNPLGIAGNFHLVGFSSVTTSAHTNGNILTDTLRYQNNFGTKGVAEVSYIQKNRISQRRRLFLHVFINGFPAGGGDGGAGRYDG